MTKEYCPPPPSLPRSTGHRVAAFLRVALSPKIFTSPCPFVRPHAIPLAWSWSYSWNVVIRFTSKNSCPKCTCWLCFKLLIKLSCFFFLQFIVKDRISALDAMKHDYFFCLGKHVQELKNSKLCNISKFQELHVYAPRKTRLVSLLNVDRDVNCSYWVHLGCSGWKANLFTHKRIA